MNFPRRKEKAKDRNLKQTKQTLPSSNPCASVEQTKQGKLLQWMNNLSLHRPVEEKENEKLESEKTRPRVEVLPTNALPTHSFPLRIPLVKLLLMLVLAPLPHRYPIAITLRATSYMNEGNPSKPIPRENLSCRREKRREKKHLSHKLGVNLSQRAEDSITAYSSTYLLIFCSQPISSS